MISKRIENLAQAILDEHNENIVPVNIESLVEKYNLKIVHDDLGGDTTGLLFIDGDNIIIGVDINRNSSKQRERFTIAHEFGHYTLHRQQSNLFIDSNFKVMFRDETSSQGVNINEIQANAFAAAILMPRKLILEKIRGLNLDLSDDDVMKQLADDFQVSVMAMSYRISNLGLV